jgi:hypothetical protein
MKYLFILLLLLLTGCAGHREIAPFSCESNTNSGTFKCSGMGFTGGTAF